MADVGDRSDGGQYSLENIHLKEENRQLKEKFIKFTQKLEDLLAQMREESCKPFQGNLSSDFVEVGSTKTPSKKTGSKGQSKKAKSKTEVESLEITPIVTVDDIKEEADQDEQNDMLQYQQDGASSQEMVVNPFNSWSISAGEKTQDGGGLQLTNLLTGGEKLNCEMCDYSTISFISMKSHIKHKHTKYKETAEIYQYKCKYCPLSNWKKYNVRRHQENVHNDPVVTMKCPECDFLAPKRPVLVRHRKLFHYRCDECQFVGEGPDDLKFHLQSVHGAGSVLEFESDLTQGSMLGLKVELEPDADVIDLDGSEDASHYEDMGEAYETTDMVETDYGNLEDFAQGDTPENIEDETFENIEVNPHEIITDNADEDIAENISAAEVDGETGTNGEEITEINEEMDGPEIREDSPGAAADNGVVVPYDEDGENNYEEGYIQNMFGISEACDDFKIPRERNKKVQCDVCGSYCRDKYHLQRHKNAVHFKKRNSRYACKLCDFIGRDLYSLKRHTFSKKHGQELGTT